MFGKKFISIFCGLIYFVQVIQIFKSCKNCTLTDTVWYNYLILFFSEVSGFLVFWFTNIFVTSFAVTTFNYMPVFFFITDKQTCFWFDYANHITYVFILDLLWWLNYFFFLCKSWLRIIITSNGYTSMVPTHTLFMITDRH